MALTKEAGERLWEKRWDSWVAKARAKHGDRYQYPSSARVDGKITIVCPDHGEFQQAPNKHIFGRGCSKCAGRDTDKLQDLKTKYPDWNWEGVDVTSSKGRFTLTCQEHGEFETLYNRLMNREAGLSPCPKCNKVSGGKSARVPEQEWDKRIEAAWGDQLKRVGPAATCQGFTEFECKDHGRFASRLLDITNGHGCPKCAASKSRAEVEIAEYLTGLGIAVELHNRKLLGGFEIDIYLPDYRIGIEHCGMYWHGDKVLDVSPDQHQRKLELAEAAGIRLITMFEDEWVFETDKMKGALINALGFGVEIGARETVITEIPWQDAKAFLETWHIQGAGLPGEFRQGLLHNGELVAVAVWGKQRFGAKDPLRRELYRLCIKGGTHVRGVIGKVTSHAGNYFRPDGVQVLVTYADLRWGTGEGYRRAGYTPAGRTKPGYFWCKGLQRYSRQDMQKHKLNSVLKNFDENLTEEENCRANGYWKIYDCGSSRWEFMV